MVVAFLIFVIAEISDSVLAAPVGRDSDHPMNTQPQTIETTFALDVYTGNPNLPDTNRGVILGASSSSTSDWPDYLVTSFAEARQCASHLSPSQSATLHFLEEPREAERYLRKIRNYLNRPSSLPHHLFNVGTYLFPKDLSKVDVRVYITPIPDVSDDEK